MVERAWGAGRSYSEKTGDGERKNRAGGSARPRRFAFYRILGNDLPPRHAAGQTLDNVRFILENEPVLVGCTKHWVLNRITDAEVEARLVALLEAHGQSYVRIPFVPAEYAAQEWDVASLTDEDYAAGLGEPDAEGIVHQRIEYRVRLDKNRYVMNNNGARNFALDHGRANADYILPFDGSLFLTTEAWNEIVAATQVDPAPHYLIVPMARIGSDPQSLLREGIPKDATEEPQIAFHRDAEARFDDGLGYGYRPKVELLGRLGVLKGNLATSRDRWDLPRRDPPSDSDRVVTVGRIARLPSGSSRQEVGTQAANARFSARNTAIYAKLDGLDRAFIEARLDPERLMVLDPAAIEAVAAASPGSFGAGLRNEIVAAAEAALAKGVRSVLDKTEIAPSGDRRDYHSRAPYWWPDPDKPGGLPYIRRDGVRNPQADPSRPESSAFDAGRLQAVLQDTIACALASRLTGEARYGAFGAEMVRRWFLSPESAMNPNFAFAQVRPGHVDKPPKPPKLKVRLRRRLRALKHALRGVQLAEPERLPVPAPILTERGRGAGLIEIRYLPPFLDAVRLLVQAGHLTPDEHEALRRWFAAFAQWMRTSYQGREARVARNNIGVYYDVEMLAIAAFTGDVDEIPATLRRMRVRLKFQFDETGGQGLEAERTRPIHYSSLNLFGWAELVSMTSRLGVDVPDWGGGVLKRALMHLLALGPDRFATQEVGDGNLYAALEAVRPAFGIKVEAGPAVLDPVDAYGPFWQLYDARSLPPLSRPVASPARLDAPVA